MIRKGLVRLTQRADGTFLIELGQPGWREGDSTFYYRLEFVGEVSDNISMQEGLWEWATLPEWPPTPVNGALVLEGDVWGFPSDGFVAESLTHLSVRLLTPVVEGRQCSPEFDLVFVDENGTEQIWALGVTEAAWPLQERAAFRPGVDRVT